MKKLILTFGLGLLSFSSFSQAIFRLEAPAAVVANYVFEPSNGWGADLNIAANAVLDTVVVVDDGTAGDSLSCSASPAGAYTEKIAMLYRGSCEFGLKALNAQNAGARAVIIVNNDAANPDAVMSPGAGASGASVTIPVILCSYNTGQLIRAQMALGEDVVAYIGTSIGYFDNDGGISEFQLLRTPFGSLPTTMTNNILVPLGGFAYNRGAMDQAAVTLNVTANDGAADLYNETSAGTNITSGDSAFISLPDMDISGWPAGTYTLTYTIGLGGADQNTLNNTFESYFSISDSMYSMVKLDDTKILRRGSIFRTAANVTNEFTMCLPMKNPNSDNVFAEGMYFGGIITSGGTISIAGAELEANFYQWDDEFTGVANTTLDALIPLVDPPVSFIFDGDNQDSTIYFDFPEPIELDANQRYLACVSDFAPTSRFYAFDEDYYDMTIDTLDEPLTVFIIDGTASLGFAGGNTAPCVAVKTSKNDAGLKEATEVSGSAYPNPARDVITVMVNGTGNATLKVTDLSGRVVSTQDVKVAGGKFVTDVAGMNAGTYVFSLDFENGTHSQFKVVVTK